MKKKCKKKDADMDFFIAVYKVVFFIEAMQQTVKYQNITVAEITNEFLRTGGKSLYDIPKIAKKISNKKKKGKKA